MAAVNGKVRERWRRDVLGEHAEALSALIRRHGVLAAYVFGSLARGRDPARVKDRSDLDLAVLFPEAWDPDERSRARLAVGNGVAGIAVMPLCRYPSFLVCGRIRPTPCPTCR